MDDFTTFLICSCRPILLIICKRDFLVLTLYNSNISQIGPKFIFNINSFLMPPIVNYFICLDKFISNVNEIGPINQDFCNNSTLTPSSQESYTLILRHIHLYIFWLIRSNSSYWGLKLHKDSIQSAQWFWTYKMYMHKLGHLYFQPFTTTINKTEWHWLRY